MKFLLRHSTLCAVVSILSTPALMRVFTRPRNSAYDYDLAVAGNRLCAIPLLFDGLNMFAVYRVV